MNDRGVEKEIETLQKQIATEEGDFSAAYVAVNDLARLLLSHPQRASRETVKALSAVLQSQKHRSQKQAFFLYKEAALILTALTVSPETPPVVLKKALTTLKMLAIKEEGPAHRAATEALGSLPLDIKGPSLQETTPFCGEMSTLSWSELLRRAKVPCAKNMRMYGRSFALDCGKGNQWFVVKLLRREDSVTLSLREAQWMKHLQSSCSSLPKRFDIPKPFEINGNCLLSLTDGPHRERAAEGLHPDGYAIAFWAHRDYYSYINEHHAVASLGAQQFISALHRNAWLLGNLASRGMVHSAPLPLFHNRVQRARRADGGAYQWQRRGRLDQWLHSCRYPNLGLTGIRDLEHLISFEGTPRELYLHIGTHILSLLLVTGSYYRNKEVSLSGLDERGNPVDTRSLFDMEHLEQSILTIVDGYHRGFTKKPLKEDLEAWARDLAIQMREEMGVDKHMEEVLRAADQKDMTDDAFRLFLMERGLSHEASAGFNKGEKDISLLTGPHLGGFNQHISIPQMIDFVATVAALCVASRFQARRSFEQGAAPIPEGRTGFSREAFFP